MIVSSPFGASLASSFDDSEIKHIEYPAWFEGSPFFDLAEELDKAGAEEKQGLMVLFTTEGCSYCDEFIRTSLGDSVIASIVQENFVSVGMEIFDDTGMTDPRGVSMPVKKFAKKEGVEFSPTLLFYDNDGERILRQVGYQSPARFRVILDYITSGGFRSKSLRDYFNSIADKEAMEQPVMALVDDPLFSKPPYAMDRRVPASQPLLVIFENNGCQECNEFHENVLARNDVRDTLEKFEIIRLDVADDETIIITPDGNRTTPATWFRQTAFSRLPALVFFDERGNEVLKTDALVLPQRMMNSLFYVLERAFEKGWTYQRFARSRGIEKLQRDDKQ
ncbi:MAG: thioredoxin fold domain-containing protein [Gammaproteobacteria bacterium]